MRVTREVSKWERSRDASDEQLQNIHPMSVTCEVSQPERSRDASEEQPQNVPL